MLSQPVLPAPNAGALSPIQFVLPAQCFLFDDGQTLYCYSLNCLQLWTFTPRAAFNGWTAGGNDLYFQDGSVTCQFDLNALAGAGGGPLIPVNAFNLRTRTGW